MGRLVASLGLLMTLLTRCSGGIEVQHKTTPRRGVWWSAMFWSGYQSMDPQCLTISQALRCSPQWMACVLRDWWVRWAKRVASADNFTRRARDQVFDDDIIHADFTPYGFHRFVVQGIERSKSWVIRRLRFSHPDELPTECSARKCIAPDGIGCIMGHANSEFAIQFSCHRIPKAGEGC